MSLSTSLTRLNKTRPAGVHAVHPWLITQALVPNHTLFCTRCLLVHYTPCDPRHSMQQLDSPTPQHPEIQEAQLSHQSLHTV